MESRHSVFFFILLFLFSFCGNSFAHAAKHSLNFQGSNLQTSELTQFALPKDSHGAVVIFLSAICPCSNSHLQELRELSKEFSNFAFIGIHSNSDESQEESTAYFKNNPLPFPVIRDQKSKIADDFKAVKTPHAYIVNASGEILFQGGVSDSSDFSYANKKYLRMALVELQNGNKVKVAKSRPLGCAISRGEGHDW